jgi:predicted TIM-barrel fold metal-dependent hydrolase
MGRVATSLLEVLNRIGLVDQHAHGIVLEVDGLDAFRGLFSESPHPAQWPHTATGVTYRRAIRELAALYRVEPTEQAVYEYRQAADPDRYAELLLRSTGTDWLLVDEGYPAAGAGPDWRRMGELAGCRSAPVLRIESVAEERLNDGLAALREHVRGRVAGARAAGYVGLKTIAAYRSGLDVGPPDPAAAEAALALTARRVDAKPLLELLLWDALEANAADPLPVQVHVGFGDSDLDLTRARPAQLKPLVERHPHMPFVLLHCYPFVREAGWMAHVYPNVYLDLSLTIPHVSRPSEAIREALELAPVSKLLFASDAARAPELYHLAGRWWRESLAEVLGELLPVGDAEQAGRAILRENAMTLYRLEA